MSTDGKSVAFVVVLFGQNGIGSHDYSFVGVV